MKHLVLGLAIMSAGIAAPVAASSPDFDAEFDRAVKTFGVPGAVVIVVQGDRIVYQRARGVVKAGGRARVTPDTRFAIGSITKSFTAAAIARLVDEGRLKWDDKAVAHLPDLRMHDDYVTRELTIRDMLSHRSGLPSGAGDLLSWPQTDIPLDDRLARLRSLPLTRGFRARYGYSNLLYAAAGKIVGRASGQDWTEYVKRNFFLPLKMSTAAPSSAGLDDRTTAWPHARFGGPIRGMGDVQPLPRRYGVDGADGAAGAIYASGIDMARWMSVQLAQGALVTGGRLFSEAAAREMHALQTPLRIQKTEGAFAPTDPSFSGYGLGWFIRDYHGNKLVYHGGGTLGGVAQMTLLPKQGYGFIVLTNSEETGFLRAIELMLLDRYLQRPPTDWTRLQMAADAADRTKALATLRAEESKIDRSAPSMPLAAYAGRYRDDWFGVVQVERRPRGLSILFDRSPYLKGPLIHVGGDVFRTKFTEPGMEDAYISFRRADGRIAGATLRAVSPLADFSFDYKDLNLMKVDR